MDTNKVRKTKKTNRGWTQIYADKLQFLDQLWALTPWSARSLLDFQCKEMAAVQRSTSFNWEWTVVEAKFICVNLRPSNEWDLYDL
jgi:hypothetical protein